MSTEAVRPRILVVEDDLKLAKALRAEIANSGYEVQVASSGEEGFFLVYSFRPDLIVLDLTLPGRSGLEILRQVREQGHDLRVLVLTSHNEVEDRVTGLRSGADDYLGKPFSFTELFARIEALLRRTIPPAEAPALQMADLIVHVNARKVTRADGEVVLTQREFDLLLYLIENRGRTVSREMLSRDVWRETSRFTAIDNVIDVQIKRLRRKIDDPFPVKLLQTIRGVGFTLREPQS